MNLPEDPSARRVAKVLSQAGVKIFGRRPGHVTQLGHVAFNEGGLHRRGE